MLDQRINPNYKKEIAYQNEISIWQELAKEDPEAPVLFVGDQQYIIHDGWSDSYDDCFDDYVDFLRFRLHALQKKYGKRQGLDRLADELDFINADDFLVWSYGANIADWESVICDAYDEQDLGDYVG